MNDEFDNLDIDTRSFSYRDLIGQDKWETFTPTFTNLTVVGATTYVGRFRVVGRQCFFQVSLLAATSIASTAGSTYMALPVTPQGIAGMGTMANETTDIAVGVCSIDATNGRCYLPSQIASANTFTLAGWYEV